DQTGPRTGRDGSRAQLLRLHPVTAPDGRQSRRDATIARCLPCRSHRLDPAAQTEIGPRERSVHRRRGSQPDALSASASMVGLRRSARKFGPRSARQAPRRGAITTLQPQSSMKHHTRTLALSVACLLLTTQVLVPLGRVQAAEGATTKPNIVI